LLPIIQDSLRLIEAQAEENGIRISLVEDGKIPKIAGDPEFLRSVFNNLFINAVQALGNDGGIIKVMLASDGSEAVRIEVSDNGPGIPQENLEKIFEPYFSTKETGTGLGLAIVKKIIEVHNGLISVAAGENGGARFIIVLPGAAVETKEQD
jgi:two-component system sensor histidine kinase HydH